MKEKYDIYNLFQWNVLSTQIVEAIRSATTTNALTHAWLKTLVPQMPFVLEETMLPPVSVLKDWSETHMSTVKL